MRLLRAVVPLIMLMAASPAVMAESEYCKYDWCDLDGECLSTCVAVYDNIFLEGASQSTITSNTATSNTNTNTNSVSNRIASLLERLERVEIATRQHTAHTASSASASHQPITGIVDTDEYNPDPDGDFMPFRRAQVGLRPPTDDGLMEQHISMPALMERMARIEKSQQQQHDDDDDDDDDDDEPQTGIIGTDDEVPGEEGPGQQFFRGQFGPHSFNTENSEQYPSFLERHHSNSHLAEQMQHLATEQHNTNTNTDDHGFPIHFGGVAKEDGSWFTYATGAADEPQHEEDYFSLLEQRARAAHARLSASQPSDDEDDFALLEQRARAAHARHVASEPSQDYIALLEQRARAAHARHSAAASSSEPQTGIIGTDDEIPGEDGPGQQFFRGQFGPHTMNEDEDDEHGFTAMMERIQRLEHTMNMAEEQQHQQQQQSSLLEASTTTQHHSRLRRLRAAIDATRT